MLRPVFLLIFNLLLFLFFSSKIFAAGEFKTDYRSSYVVDENGKTRVTQDVTIENLTSQYFVSQYEFTIGSTNLANITAWDSTGALNPTVTKEDGKTKISLQFRAKVVGKSNQLSFGVSYDFLGLANQNGLAWEVNLLRLSGLDAISSYTLTLSVPQAFGPLLFAFPNPVSQRNFGTQRLLTYDKQALLQGAPRMGFGEFQLYQLTLKYHLRNPSLGLGYTEVAIPPDIRGIQQIIQKSFLPEPVSIRVDGDGNYLARYNLGPFEEKEVVWEGFVALFYSSWSTAPGKIDSLPNDLVQRYTKQQEYWETSAVEIKAQAAQLTDPNLSVAQNLRRIYDFVTGNLTYDYQKLTSGDLIRLGALSALAQKDKAVCMEYTDLLIALARASGIPAREINGYAYTADDTNRPLSLRLEKGDVLHAWPQVYLPDAGWVMIDPTWGSTSGSDYFNVFDLSHLSFVIKGEDSQYPLPAGSYKTDPNQKDVYVSFSSEKDFLKEKPNLELGISFGFLVVSPFPVESTITVRNTSRVSAFQTKLFITAGFLNPEETTIDLGTIPPGGAISRTVKFLPENAFTGGAEELKAAATALNFEGGETSSGGSSSTMVYPIYVPLGALALLSALVIFARRVWSAYGKI